MNGAMHSNACFYNRAFCRVQFLIQQKGFQTIIEPRELSFFSISREIYPHRLYEWKITLITLIIREISLPISSDKWRVLLSFFLFFKYRMNNSLNS